MADGMAISPVRPKRGDARMEVDRNRSVVSKYL